MANMYIQMAASFRRARRINDKGAPRRRPRQPPLLLSRNTHSAPTTRRHNFTAGQRGDSRMLPPECQDIDALPVMQISRHVGLRWRAHRRAEPQLCRSPQDILVLSAGDNGGE